MALQAHMVAGDSTSPSTIEQQVGHDPLLGLVNEPEHPAAGTPLNDVAGRWSWLEAAATSTRPRKQHRYRWASELTVGD